uniref:Uncharacterized protein n=1 Tax=Photinus pyralis TaxID=7054 RepID=A0A1Y1M4J0_PHOPY
MARREELGENDAQDRRTKGSIIGAVKRNRLGNEGKIRREGRRKKYRYRFRFTTELGDEEKQTRDKRELLLERTERIANMSRNMEDDNGENTHTWGTGWVIIS